MTVTPKISATNSWSLLQTPKPHPDVGLLHIISVAAFELTNLIPGFAWHGYAPLASATSAGSYGISHVLPCLAFCWCRQGHSRTQHWNRPPPHPRWRPPLAPEHPRIHPPQAGHLPHVCSGQCDQKNCCHFCLSTASQEPSHLGQPGRHGHGNIRWVRIFVTSQMITSD